MTEPAKDKKENLIDSQVLKYFLLAGLGICVILLVYYLIVKNNSGARGTFGDMFGGVNALFSGLAFSGIIITIFVQMKELKLQREVQIETQIELENQKKEFQIQNKTLRIQRFENTFFQLLGIHHNIVENMTIKINNDDYETIQNTKKNHSKRAVFDYFFNYNLRGNIFNDVSGINNLTFKDFESAASFERVYLEVYSKVQDTLGLYFRNLYTILKFVDSYEFVNYQKVEEELRHLGVEQVDRLYHQLNITKRYQYTAMLSAQLSDYENYWVCFNSMISRNEEMKLLIEKYSFLENFPSERIRNDIMINAANLSGYYSQSAFFKKRNDKIIQNLKNHHRESIIREILD